MIPDCIDLCVSMSTIRIECENQNVVSLKMSSNSNPSSNEACSGSAERCNENDVTRCSLSLHSESELNDAQFSRGSEIPIKFKSSERQSSSYEKWLLDKEKSRRRLELDKNALAENQEDNNLRMKGEMEVKLENARTKYRERLKTIDKTAKEVVAKKVEEFIAKEINSRLQKSETEKKCKENFKAWLMKKNRLKTDLLQQSKCSTVVRDLNNDAHHQRNEDAFQNWCAKAANRPKSLHRSYGYSNGLLISYYDSSTLTQPAYVNPQPWKHP